MQKQKLIILLSSLLFLTAPLSRADSGVVVPDTPIDDDDDDTSPDSTAVVSSPPTRPTDSAYYDLQGRKVTSLIKGHIYIHQGKKVLSQ